MQKVYSISLKGLRPQNEDTEVIIINFDRKETNMNNINLFAIFDGHGGKLVSNSLKENLPKFFIDKRVEYPLSKRYVVNVYDYIQKYLSKYEFSKHMGSTGLVVIHFKTNEGEFLNVINNGDCRCILCRDNFAMPLSKDHKPNWPEEKIRIAKLGGKITFDGFDWRIKDLSVSRAFGDTDATPFVTHRPDLFRFKLDKNDKFIIMACDGLWDVMSSQDAINYIIINCYDENLKIRINKNINIAKKLAELAIAKGSGDNVSIIVIFFD